MPFSVGDSVEWSLANNPDDEWLETAIGRALAREVTHTEDHHDVDEGSVVRRGTVLSIRCAYSRYAPNPGADPRMLYPVPGSEELKEVQGVDGHEGAGEDLHFNGYLVELELNAE